MSKDCGNHKKWWRRKTFKRLLIAFLALLLLAVLVLLIVFLVIRPTKPTFRLQDATLYAFNLSSAPSPSTLSSTIQITLVSRNPNSAAAIYYDRLDAFASYHDQQITLHTRIGPTYQGHKDVDVWSPFLIGATVPIAPYICESLSLDQTSGAVSLLIKADGRIRWKVGTIISRGYNLHVTCPAFITLGSRSTGVAVGNAVKYQLAQDCSVSI